MRVAKAHVVGANDGSENLSCARLSPTNLQVDLFFRSGAIHDQLENAERDQMKNSLIAATGLPFFRLRAETPDSMSTDEWYALLSDQVLPHLDLAKRIRCRQAAYSLIPC